MITISTYMLVGLTEDMLKFAPSAVTDRDRAYLRYAWDGTQLTISTCDTSHGALATWAAGADSSDTLGGADEPWDILVKTTKAKMLVKTFQLKGGTSETLVAIESRDKGLFVTRQATDDVTYAQQCFPGDLSVTPPKVLNLFGNLGERNDERPFRAGDKVLGGLHAAAKRIGEPASAVMFERGARAQVGAHLAVFWRHPADEDVAQAKADEDAIVAASLEDVGGAA